MRLACFVIFIGLLAAAPAALACNCPKEAMIKKYGTVSMIHHPVPLTETAPAPDALLPLPPLSPQPASSPTPAAPKPEPQS